MTAFLLKVLAAEKPFYEGECLSLVLPTVDGQYGIQAGHSDVIVAVVPGELKITLPSGERILAAVSDGLVKVEDGKALILVDTAEHPEEIDENRARLAAENAKEALLQKKSVQEYYFAQAKMARALSRLRVKNRGGN